MQYRGMSFWEAMGTPVGNYNPSYMYILNIVSRIGISDLYLIKTVSVMFDLLLAFFVMKLVSLKTESLNFRMLAFILAFAVPTVVLNSSMWAQCDSIYTAFALGSVYFGLRGRSKVAYVFIALALSFKLQAAFILPFFAVFIIKNKIKLRDCYVFFLTYFAMLLPAVIAGRSIVDLLMVYINQTGTYHFLKLNAVNIWQLVGDVEFGGFRIAGLYISGLAVLGLLYFTYVNRERLVQTVDYIRLVFLFAVILPFLLPQMHDRFFYMADVLSLLVFLFDKRRWYVPLVTVFCSYTAYAWYLMNWAVLVDYKYAALALMVVIFTVLRDYVLSLRTPPPENTDR
jgi:Gpi18-like mannosyltransferase